MHDQFAREAFWRGRLAGTARIIRPSHPDSVTAPLPVFVRRYPRQSALLSQAVRSISRSKLV